MKKEISRRNNRENKTRLTVKTICQKASEMTQTSPMHGKMLITHTKEAGDDSDRGQV